MSYEDVQRRLRHGEIVILDGGTGTELEKRGAAMHPDAWCGPASLDNVGLLERVHLDYMDAGAEIIATNTFASSRMLLRRAGLDHKFYEINRAAIDAALRAREKSGLGDTLVAGSLSHMVPLVSGTILPDRSRFPSRMEMSDAFEELAQLFREEGCDLIVLEMMFDPERMELAFTAARNSGLPVWAGLSARAGKGHTLLSYAQDIDIPFQEVLGVLEDFDVAAAGVMHTGSHLIEQGIEILKESFVGPLIAYPDSGYMKKLPNWQFEEIISPEELLGFARSWVGQGVQVVGGCCGLSPHHIAALRPLKYLEPQIPAFNK